MIVRFTDPHPGRGGALVSLPRDWVTMCVFLDGTTADLDEVVRCLRAYADATSGTGDSTFLDARVEVHQTYVELIAMTNPKLTGHHWRPVSCERVD